MSERESLGLIGLFYLLPNDRLVVEQKKVEDCPSLNGFHDVEEGHLQFFEEILYPKYRLQIPSLINDYAYYPRGRVLYREKDQTFVIYIDRCLIKRPEIKAGILKAFALKKAQWRQDEQYQCAGCNKQLKEDIETCESLKNDS